MKTVLSPEVATFRITTRCNNNCKHCFASKKTTREMDLEELKTLFKLFVLKGIRAVVLTGGEPLVRRDIPEILRELNSNKLQIFLDTNGDYFQQYKDEIVRHIEDLGFPIDFSDRSYRNKNNLKSVLDALIYLKTIKKRPRIRIGTVLTKDNVRTLNNIGELLINYPIDTWKIFQFIPMNENAIKNRIHLEISEREFDEATQKIKEAYSEYFQIVISKRNRRSRGYFFIDSDGIIFMPVFSPTICKEVVIGNIFDDDIIEKWRLSAAKQNYINNAEITFQYNFSKI